MAEDLNSVIVVGRIVRDAELQYTSSGWAILKGSIAVNRRRKQGDQWVDEANFFDFSLFGKRGESLQQYMKKGQQIAIEGHLKQDRWQDQGGNNRSKVSIEAGNIQLLGGKKDSQNGNGIQSTPEYQNNSNNMYGQGSQYNQYNQQGQAEKFEDDIPY